MPSKKTISASSLATYLGCGEKYRLQYENGAVERGPSNADMIAGTGFHAAMEYAFRHVIAGESPTIAAAVAHGMAVAHNEWKSQGVVVDSILSVSPAEELDAMLTRVQRASRWYLSNMFDTFYPAVAEHAFSIDIPNTDWQLTGKIDLIEQDGSVIDFKFSGSPAPPHKDRADRSEQLSVYALARYMETGNVPPSVRLEFCRDGGKRITSVTRSSARTEKDCKRMLTRIQRVIECIESGVYPIASRDGIECSGQRCHFFHKCPYGGA